MKIFILISVFAFGVTLHDVPWLDKSGQKRIDKTFEKLWKDQEVEIITLDVSMVVQKELGFKIRKQTLYKLIGNAKHLGYMYLDKAPSKFDKFDYMVIYNTDLTIKEVKVLVYREDQGGEIMSGSFVRQFRGKNSFSQLELGKDIQGISGATISCRSTVEGVKKLTKRIYKLNQSGKL